MGRPRKVLTDEQVGQIEKLAPVMTQAQIADFFGISDRTLRQRLADDERVSAAYKKGRATAIGMAGSNLLSLVRDRNLGAICFYLKTQAGWNETQVVKVDSEKIKDLSDAELDALVAGKPPRP